MRGNRNNILHELALESRKAGMNKPDIKDAVEKRNAEFDTPLAHEEVASLLSFI